MTGPGNEMAISATKRHRSWVAFVSWSDNLSPDDGAVDFDIYVKDVATGRLVLASTSATGVKDNAGSSSVSLSYDGSVIAFDSFANNLHPADTDFVYDVYLKSLDTLDADTVENVAFEAGVNLVGDAFFARGWGDGEIVAPSTVTDGQFLPPGHQWDQGPVWWDLSAPRARAEVHVDLDGTCTVESLILQADNNDAYAIEYRVGDESWKRACRSPTTGCSAMACAPDPIPRQTRPPCVAATDRGHRIPDHRARLAVTRSLLLDFRVSGVRHVSLTVRASSGSPGARIG